jgi:hypothetical protein
MGGINGRHISTSDAEYFAFQVVREEYERILQNSKQSEMPLAYSDNSEMLVRLENLYNESVNEFGIPLLECKSAPVVLSKVASLSPEARIAMTQTVLDAEIAREKRVFKIREKQRKNSDYSQSFGGTADDTKNEREAAALLRGGNNAEEEVDPVLVRPVWMNAFEYQSLRGAGKWCKYLASEGCYVYIHDLTREVVSLRPDEFVDDPVDKVGAREDGVAEVDPANGLPKVAMTDLPAVIDDIILGKKQTPLIVDCSLEQNARVYFSYKGMLEVS